MRAVLMLLASLCASSHVLAANWLQVSVNNDGYYFLDADSITTVNRPAGIIEVWVKAMFEDNDLIKRADGESYALNKIVAQEWFDCTKSQYKMIQLISYDETDTVQDSYHSQNSMRNVTPNSNDADAMNMACRLWAQRKSN